MSKPLVAIIGRPNVGKSTLFNRLTKSRTAIVDDEPGVTRDRLYGTVEWGTNKFDVIDTGGIVLDSDGQIEVGIRDQAIFASEQSDLTLLLVDAQTGITQDDLRIAKLLLKNKKPLLITVNKSDNPTLEIDSANFYQLGAGEPFAISALHGRNIWEFIEKIASFLTFSTSQSNIEFDCRVAIVGRPNVGKSSFVNLLLGENRMLVADEAGTTRDSVDSVLKFQSKSILLTDTAGLRKRTKVKRGIEQFSTLRSYRALSNAEVGLVILDATTDFGNSEEYIFQFAWENGIGLVVAMNKWDAIEKDETEFLKVEKRFYDRFPYLEGVPFKAISVKKKQRVFKVLDEVLQVSENRKRKITTSELNEWLHGLWTHRPPPATKGKFLKLRYVTQSDVAPPKFIIFCSYPELLATSYKRFIEKQFRKQFSFNGVPLSFDYRKK